ncbi:NADH-quinone oxidoreductase subunit D [Humisphaera borealis]|uniref:NADH-quinone oxidoreductase subunit D n=1 Tax=Humisphaera borealis TaxID=2807512 RepID=A0A7M2WWP5_9BACT|nr:NADH-quinone oxidoreductase subunit D [Humisphaera borealis]QOV89958.1 NADH-quinone oxidoreductase subunit D [Humisphaera borealis]
MTTSSPKTLAYDLLPGGGDDQIDVATEEMLVNMGPQHPSTHGVLRVVLRTDGEMVLDAVAHLGYLHRCKEKIAENLAYFQFMPYTDRLDYLSAMNNNHAWSMAVEKLANIEVPQRAEYIRVIAAELNRIASHLVSFGTYGLDMGAFSPFLYAFREREYILDLFEQLCGARLTLSYINVGGVTWDLPPLFLEKLTEFLDYFEPKVDEYNALLTRNHIFIKRTANIGVVSKQLAIDYALSGPMIRGSGIPMDLRRDRPYSVYPKLEFDVCVGDGQVGQLGDCWDRYWVKMQEMKQCIRILRQAIAQVPDGPYRAKLPKSLKVPPGEVYFEAENPRGHLGFFIESQGGTIPYRVKIRGPSFVNLACLSELCRGVLLADVPAIIGSIDIVMGETDR